MEHEPDPEPPRRRRLRLGAPDVDGWLALEFAEAPEFEESELGTSLNGCECRRFRLGDRIDVTVDRVDVPRGRVSLSPRARRST